MISGTSGNGIIGTRPAEFNRILEAFFRKIGWKG